MAKKIVSLLCALAMLVTMVVVSAFSASAAEVEHPIEGVFAAANATVETNSGIAVGKNRYVAHDTDYGFGDVLVLFGGSRFVQATNTNGGSHFDLGDKFTASWYYIFKHEGASTMSSTVKIGDLTVLLDRISGTTSTGQVIASVSYGDTVLATSSAAEIAGLGDHADAYASLCAALQSANMLQTSSGIENTGDKRYASVTLEYDNGDVTVTVADRTGTKITLNGTVASPDFSAADIFARLDHVTSRPSFLGGFSVSYYTEVSNAAIFHANDGTGAYTEVELDGTGLPTMPADPTRTGYIFDGWFTAAENGDEVTASTVLTAGQNVYAHWHVDPNAMLGFTYAGTTANKGDAHLFVSTEHFVNAIYTQGSGTGVSQTTTGVVGTYTMGTFQFDVTLWMAASGTDSYKINVGDLVITFTKTEMNAAYVYECAIAATYGGNALTLSSTTLNAVYARTDDGNMPTKAEISPN